ncbi:hypothetical protein DM01DRAFT_1331336 [Hesseltinella vesiculosa]|uniref:Metal homeostatis protein bsd2 n=1 Tax=Hesseltinella vesiculosa TaxID=101127 RepID=A0A1X2GW83_9FUNG|nr:hypothetical protein DM01DRAFT_1331336 [Hesseltinella vesiculosa]
MPRYQQLSTTDDPSPQPPTSPRPHSPSRQSSTLSIPLQRQQQQRDELVDTFGEDFDELDNDDSNEQQHLLYQPSSSAATPPSPILPRQTSQSNRPAVLPVPTNDGVFSNMSAKPESESAKVDETPPSYDVAMQDATPPYWQTTVIAPLGMGDVVLVEGLPVGSVLAFAWNLLVSSSFQFVGFMLTYLLHTSHAAKNGSLAGLGISLVQTGFYIRSRESLVMDDSDWGDDDSSNSNSGQTTEEEQMDADILSYVMMVIGWFLIIRAVADYARTKKMEAIISQEPAQPSADNLV